MPDKAKTAFHWYQNMPDPDDGRAMIQWIYAILAQGRAEERKNTKKLEAMLASVAHAAYRMSLSNTPFLNKISNRIRQPEIGELVIEISSFHSGGRAIGILRKKPPDPKLYADGWIIELRDGTMQTWNNSEMVAVPTSDLVRSVEKLKQESSNV